jgi:hypothetical protein
MSLWTPSGEHPVGDDRPGRRSGDAPGDAPEAATGREAGGGDGDPFGPGDAGEVDALRRELADAPADLVVANHCYGLFELAAVYLSDSPPHLDDARLAIDALGFLVDGLGERLGDAHPSLRDALAQIRLAFVQIAAAGDQPGPGAGDGAEPAT